LSVLLIFTCVFAIVALERGLVLNDSKYACKFSVLAVPRQTGMFMMNMQVYDIVPHSIESDSSGRPLSVVWCAVFNLKGMQKDG